MKTVKFYFSDGKSVQLESTEIPSEYNYFVYVGKKIASYANLYIGYHVYPKAMFLKQFYNNNLVDKDIVKVEFYSDTFLLDSFEKNSNKVIDVRWQAGKIKTGEEMLQEAIDITERFI